MNIDLNSLLLAFIGTLVGLIAWFSRREFSRLDKMADAVTAMSGRFIALEKDIKEALVLKAHLVPIEQSFHRFFGERGEKETMWAKIDAQQAQVEAILAALRDEKIPVRRQDG